MPEIVVAPKPIAAVTLTGEGTNPLNLGLDRLGRVFVMTGSGTRTLVIDTTAIAPIDSFGLLAHNLPSGSTWRIRGGSSMANLAPTGGVAGANPVGAVTFDSGSLSTNASIEAESRVHKNGLHYMATPISGRYWRVDITTNASAAVGRLVIGAAFTLREPRDYGWETRVIDLGSVERTQSGLEDVLIRAKVLEFSWVWGGLTDNEARNLALDLMAYAGTTRDVLICLDTAAANVHNLLGFGKMADPAVAMNYAEGWNEMKCRLQSKLVLAL